jgi:hypothetical protein
MITCCLSATNLRLFSDFHSIADYFFDRRREKRRGKGMVMGVNDCSVVNKNNQKKVHGFFFILEERKRLIWEKNRFDRPKKSS